MHSNIHNTQQFYGSNIGALLNKILLKKKNIQIIIKKLIKKHTAAARDTLASRYNGGPIKGFLEALGTISYCRDVQEISGGP